MTMSPEQMRKKSVAMADAQRHARYSQAEYERDHDAHSEPEPSKPIAAEGKRVKAATDKETADMGKPDNSPNASIRF